MIHDALKFYGAPKLCSKMTFKLGSTKSPLAPSILDLYGLVNQTMTLEQELPVEFSLQLHLPILLNHNNAWRRFRLI